MEKDIVTININRKDKIYISIIAVLVVAIIVLAICLPRPYKIVEVEKTNNVIEYIEKEPTKKANIINPNSPLFDSLSNSYVLEGKTYLSSTTFKYIDVGEFEKAQFSLMLNNNKTTFDLQPELRLQLVRQNALSFETEIVVSGYLMEALKTYLTASGVETAFNEQYLFELDFTNSRIEIIVNFISQ